MEETSIQMKTMDSDSEWVAVEMALMKNDYSKLSSKEKLALYKRTCDSMGLNYMTVPLGYFTLQGKEMLYAKKSCAEQLNKIHGISVSEMTTTFDEKTRIYTVVVKMIARDGRVNIDRGDVFIPVTLTGNDLANAYMKGVSKAKRRCTLGMCGMGFLDETEVQDVRGAVTSEVHQIEGPSEFIPKTRTNHYASKEAKAALFASFKELSTKVAGLKDQLAGKFPGLDSATMTTVQLEEINQWLIKMTKERNETHT